MGRIVSGSRLCRGFPIVHLRCDIHIGRCEDKNICGYALNVSAQGIGCAAHEVEHLLCQIRFHPFQVDDDRFSGFQIVHQLGAQILAERSRDNGRTPMQWDDSHAAGFTTGTPWIYPPENYRQINAAAQMNDETSVRAFYKKLVQLRKEMEVISEGKIEFLMKEDESVLAYRRYTDSQEMLVMCNLTSEEVPVTLPQGWENTDVLIANWDNTTALTDLTLRPYECLALIK